MRKHKKVNYNDEYNEEGIPLEKVPYRRRIGTKTNDGSDPVDKEPPEQEGKPKKKEEIKKGKKEQNSGKKDPEKTRKSVQT